MFKNKLQILFVGSLILILFFALFFILTLFADKQYSVIQPEIVSEDTIFAESENTIYFTVRSKQNFLYKTKGEEFASANEFINLDPKYQGKSLFPKAIRDTIYFDRDIPDALASYSHFKYRQKIENIPVFGADLTIHLKNKNEIYLMQGAFLKDKELPQAKISEDEVKKKALQEAKNEASSNLTLKISDTQKFLFSKKLIGLTGDEKTYNTLAVTIRSDGVIGIFAKRYFVDLATGKIIFSEDLIRGALDRRILDCKGGVTNCPAARNEGDPAVGDADIDNTYQFLGDIYNLYFDSFSRDSFDGNGSQINAFVNLTTQINCPNASWAGGTSNQIHICDGMVANDVLGHEYTHGVSENTAHFIFTDQTGAIDEAISDIFGYAIDSSDWSVGEDTVLGAIRYMDDPTRSSLSGQSPDRLFSPHYYCGDQDQGGVHVNNGVVNKGFYLLVQGGDFNGCTLGAVGKDKALALFFRALSVYLTSASDFNSLHSALMQSCSDLYVTGSATCTDVQRVLQAVEIDQQPANNQSGASCLGIERQIPACSSGPTTTPQVTDTPAPTFPPPPDSTPTASPTATLVPTDTVVPTQKPTPTPTTSDGVTSLRVNVHMEDTAAALFNEASKPSYSDADSLLIYIEGPTLSGRQFGELLYVVGSDGQSCRSSSNFPYNCGTGYIVWKGSDGASGTAPGQYKARIIQAPRGWEKIAQFQTASGSLANGSSLTLDLAIKKNAAYQSPTPTQAGATPTDTPVPTEVAPTVTLPAVRVAGDVDNNGIVNTIDYLYYIRAVTGGELPNYVNADVNEDDDVSLADRQVIVNILKRELDSSQDIRFFY